MEVSARGLIVFFVASVALACLLIGPLAKQTRVRNDAEAGLQALTLDPDTLFLAWRSHEKNVADVHEQAKKLHGVVHTAKHRNQKPKPFLKHHIERVKREIKRVKARHSQLVAASAKLAAAPKSNTTAATNTTTHNNPQIAALIAKAEGLAKKLKSAMTLHNEVTGELTRALRATGGGRRDGRRRHATTIRSLTRRLERKLGKVGGGRGMRGYLVRSTRRALHAFNNPRNLNPKDETKFKEVSRRLQKAIKRFQLRYDATAEHRRLGRRALRRLGQFEKTEGLVKHQTGGERKRNEWSALAEAMKKEHRRLTRRLIRDIREKAANEESRERGASRSADVTRVVSGLKRLTGVLTNSISRVASPRSDRD